MPRFRPRISILTTLLLMTIVGMAIVNVRLWHDVGPLRNDVRQLRDEVGRITVEDPSKLNAIQVRTKDAMIWKWRVWVPEGKITDLKLRWGDVPLEGYPAAADVTMDEIGPGEQWITVTVEKAPGIDKWQCVLEYSTERKITLPIPKNKLWFLTPRYNLCEAGVFTHSRMDNDEDGHHTFLLRRYRVQLKRKQVNVLDDPDPLPGFMLWLETK